MRAALSGHTGCRVSGSSLQCSGHEQCHGLLKTRDDTIFPVFAAGKWCSVTLIWQIWPQKLQARVAQLHKSKTYLGINSCRRKSYNPRIRRDTMGWSLGFPPFVFSGNFLPFLLLRNNNDQYLRETKEVTTGKRQSCSWLHCGG